MSLGIIETKASLLENAQRIQFSVWFGSFMLLAPKHPWVLAQRTWEREKFYPLKFDNSEWSETRERESRGSRSTISSKQI